VHPGAAGGALVDIHGAVMGMIVPYDQQSSGETAGGIVYAVPMSIATGIFESLKVARSFESPWLGVSVLTVAEYRALMQSRGLSWDREMRVLGVYVDNVFEPSPAARAGIEVGDFLIKLDGRKLPSVFDFQKSLYLTGIGRTVTVEIYRNGEMLSRQVTIEDRPSEANVSTANRGE
jgi:serine protease Do